MQNKINNKLIGRMLSTVMILSCTAIGLAAGVPSGSYTHILKPEVTDESQPDISLYGRDRSGGPYTLLAQVYNPFKFNGLTGIDAFKAGIINAFKQVDFDTQGGINRSDLCKKLGVLTEQNKWELSAEDILVKIGPKHTRLSEITQEDIRYLAALRVPMLWVYLDKKRDASTACNVM